MASGTLASPLLTEKRRAMRTFVLKRSEPLISLRKRLKNTVASSSRKDEGVGTTAPREVLAVEVRERVEVRVRVAVRVAREEAVVEVVRPPLLDAAGDSNEDGVVVSVAEGDEERERGGIADEEGEPVAPSDAVGALEAEGGGERDSRGLALAAEEAKGESDDAALPEDVGLTVSVGNPLTSPDDEILVVCEGELEAEGLADRLAIEALGDRDARAEALALRTLEGLLLQLAEPEVLPQDEREASRVALAQVVGDVVTLSVEAIEPLLEREDCARELREVDGLGLTESDPRAEMVKGALAERVATEGVGDADEKVSAEGWEEALSVSSSDLRALLLTVPVALPAGDAKGEFVGVPLTRGELEDVLLALTEAECGKEMLPAEL